MLPDRVWSRIVVGDGCWAWKGYHYPNGYGYVRYQSKPRGVHRFVYEKLVGPVPAGLELDHLCRNRGCCNPTHLEPVTRKINLSRGRNANAEKAVCKNGHSRWYVRSGRRYCAACAYGHTRRWLLRQRTATA